MKCYLLPIGGTGVRIMKSIIHLCAAGCFENTEFKIMCIDSDGVNGDLKLLKETIEEYRNNSISSHNLFPSISLAEIDSNVGVWSPLSSTVSNMKDMIHESLMSEKAQKILRFLYTDEEREKRLEGGFYGHTSIGSYFMSQQVVVNGEFTSVWQDFFNGINAEMDKIFIIGSVYGGTGASGVPTIARRIKEIALTKDVPIGAMFVMPYFRPTTVGDSLLPIDWNIFTTKSKAILSFYRSQGFDDIFNTMYFIGEDPDKFMWVKNNECGPQQINKANPIEVYAASAVLDFLKMPSSVFCAKFMTRESSDTNPADSKLTKNTLNKVAVNSMIFDKMSKFLKFSILFTKYFKYCIDDGQAQASWISRYNIDKNDSQALYNYCMKYINWMREMIISTDDNGDTNYAKENPNVVWFRANDVNLYSGIEVSNRLKGLFKKTKQYDLEELTNLSNIVKNADVSSTGEEIVTTFSTGTFPYNNNKTDLANFVDDLLSLC